MGQVAILKSGICVKIDDMNFLAYTIDGFLNTFTSSDGKKYRETLKSDFREEDQWHMYTVGGFYQEDAFLKYLNKDEDMPLYKLKEYYFTFQFAEEGDEVKVRKLKLTSPYNEFCIIETYKWIYQKNVEVVNLSTGVIVIPNGVNPTPLNGESVPLYSDTPQMFYNNHITQFVTPLTDTQEKQAKAYLFAKMALRIHQIKKEIFQLFNTVVNTDFATYLVNQDTQWRTSSIFVNPTIETLKDYYLNLTIFYKSAYANQILIQQASKGEKFYWLARCLTAEGLAIVPVDDKVELLKFISKMKVMTDGNGSEFLAVKIVESFTFDSVSATDRNTFLDALMENQIYSITNMYNQTSNYDTHQTLFEILYSKIDDNRSSRYTFGIYDTYDNRKKFVLMLYKIWKNSKYNPRYADPSYTQPANIYGVYPQSHYMELMTDAGSSLQKAKYYESNNTPAFLFYNSNDNLNSYVTSIDTNYNLSSINGKKISINIVTTTKKLEGYGLGGEPRYKTETNEVLYGTYDLYQPIALIGFKPDLSLLETFQDPETGIDLNNPTPNIPVFLLYYMEDYSNLKKIDFGIMMAAEIALNLTGVGALSKLRYLGYLSKAKSVWGGTATASEVLLSWEAVSGVNAAVQFTAGNLLAISNYVGNTSTDPDIVEFTQKVNVLLGFLTLGSLLSHPTMKRKLFDAAADVLTQERQLILAGKVHGLDTDTMNSIRGLYNIDSMIDLMQLKLNNLPSTANQTVIVKFATFTRDEKYQFFVYFYNMQEEGKWIRMDFQYSRVVSGNVQQYTLVDVWKDEIQFLKNYRTFEFVDAVNGVRRNTNLLRHVHEGDAQLIPLKNANNQFVGFTKAHVTGYHNPDVLTDFPPGSGDVSWYGNHNNSNPGNPTKGYTQGKLIRNMSDKIDPRTGNPWKVGNSNPPNHFSVKNRKNVFWPAIYTTERINEEMALAISNMDLKNPRITPPDDKGILSYIYKGKASDGHVIEIIYYGGDYSTGTITSIYPQYF